MKFALNAPVMDQSKHSIFILGVIINQISGHLTNMINGYLVSYQFTCI
jgi:hypothetical protein